MSLLTLPVYPENLCNLVKFTNYLSYFLFSPSFFAVRISETILFTSSTYGWSNYLINVIVVQSSTVDNAVIYMQINIAYVLPLSIYIGVHWKISDYF